MKEFDKIKASIIKSLSDEGMQRLFEVILPCPPEQIIVILDGCIVGSIPSNEVEEVVAKI